MSEIVIEGDRITHSETGRSAVVTEVRDQPGAWYPDYRLVELFDRTGALYHTVYRNTERGALAAVEKFFAEEGTF